MMWTGHVLARAGLGLSLLVATLVRLPHLDYVPVWDGRNYWDDCVQPALANGFDPLALNCYGHRSMLYMLTVSWPQWLARDSALVLNLTHLVVSLIAIWAFFRVMTVLFPPSQERRSGLEAALATVLFASMPIWTAPSINLNPDMGVMAGFLFALGFVLRGRIAAASLAGVFTVLSKEIGLLLWLALAGVETVVALTERRGWRKTLVPRLPYAIPILAYLAVGAALTARGLPATWDAPKNDPYTLILTFLSFDPFDPVFAAYVTDLFVLNFAWLMTVVIAVWLLAISVALLKDRKVPLPLVVERRAGIITILVTLAAFYLLTRYPTFNNPRYLMPAYPLVVVAFAAAAAALLKRTWARAGAFVIVTVLQLVSMNRTIDPVSRFAFGTFAFGEHELLTMTSRTGECCGSGRDQLVYNLQFTAFDSMQNALFAVLRPRSGEAIAISDHANWHLVGPLDPPTLKRTLRTREVIDLDIVTVGRVLAGQPLPERMRYIAYPNVNNAPPLRLFARAYRIRGPFSVEKDGYRLEYYDLVRGR